MIGPGAAGTGTPFSSASAWAARSCLVLARIRIHPVAAALTRRAGALLHADADGVLATAAAFAHAGYPYQQARTRALAAAISPGAN